MIKKLVSIIFCFLFCCFITGCKHNENKIIIKYATWGSASEIQIIKPLIKNYEKEHPDIKIELMHIPQDYFKKIHLLFASNMAPDIVFMNNLNLPVYSKYLIPLDDCINKDDYYQQAIASMSINTTLYAIPRDTSTLVIYYNKTIFDKYGIKYPDENWKMEDLITKSKQLTKKNIYGISYEPKIYYALPYLKYYNGGIFDKNGKYIFNKTNSQKGYALYQKLSHTYHIAPTEAEIGSKTVAQMFIEGKLAMHLSGRWMVPKYREVITFDWDVINFPNYSAPSDTSGWSITKTSRHKKEAIDFVKYISSEKNITKMTTDGLIVPSLKKVACSQTFKNGMPKHSKIFTKSVENSKITNITKEYNKIIDQLNDMLFISK